MLGKRPHSAWPEVMLARFPFAQDLWIANRGFLAAAVSAVRPTSAAQPCATSRTDARFDGYPRA